MGARLHGAGERHAHAAVPSAPPTPPNRLAVTGGVLGTCPPSFTAGGAREGVLAPQKHCFWCPHLCGDLNKIDKNCHPNFLAVGSQVCTEGTCRVSNESICPCYPKHVRSSKLCVWERVWGLWDYPEIARNCVPSWWKQPEMPCGMWQEGGR
jgi:hypothetical protein